MDHPIPDGLSLSGAFERHWTDVQVDFRFLKLAPIFDFEIFRMYDAQAARDAPGSSRLRVASYNVLCQQTISVTQQLYRHVQE